MLLAVRRDWCFLNGGEADLPVGVRLPNPAFDRILIERPWSGSYNNITKTSEVIG